MKAPIRLIEASWEVCNKVGGIYTVIKSKAPLLSERVDTHIAVGPLFDQLDHSSEFSQKHAPQYLQEVFDRLRRDGIQCVFGTWQLRTPVPTVLIDARGSNININAVKAALWEHFAVDSINAGYDFDEPVKWSWAVGRFVEELVSVSPQKTVLHCHEWLAGPAILYQVLSQTKIPTVFTTHATMLGRSLSSRGQHPTFNPPENPALAAKQIGVEEKHTMEVACAHAASAFTTVSNVTADEASALLGIRPRVTCNGLDEKLIPSFQRLEQMAVNSREQIIALLDDHFSSYGQVINFSQSHIFCTSGRYELHNKGYDSFIKSLAKLNKEYAGSDVSVVAIFFVLYGHQGARQELLARREAVKQLSSALKRSAGRYARRMLDCTDDDQHDSIVEVATTLSSNLMCEISAAPLSSHIITDGHHQELIALAHEQGLNNEPGDPVKILWYPLYLTGSDGLLDLTYEEAVGACDGAVFPSFYEPWGYTPAESAALGVPTITSNLSGFGRFVIDNDLDGVTVLDRSSPSKDALVHEVLADHLRNWIGLTDDERKELALRAKQSSQRISWKHFIKDYMEVYNDVSRI